MVWTEPEWQLAREPDVLSLLIIVIVGLDIAVVFKGDLRLDASAGASFWESERHGHGGVARMGVLGVCCWLLQCHQLGCVAVSLTVALNTALTYHISSTESKPRGGESGDGGPFTATGIRDTVTCIGLAEVRPMPSGWSSCIPDQPLHAVSAHSGHSVRLDSSVEFESLTPDLSSFSTRSWRDVGCLSNPHQAEVNVEHPRRVHCFFEPSGFISLTTFPWILSILIPSQRL
jgi:hypothetical protein